MIDTRSRFVWLAAAAATVAAVFGVVGTATAGAPRLATLFAEYVDGNEQPVSTVESEIAGSQALRGAVSFVDEKQSREVRSTTNAGQLINGDISAVITSLDADYILAGVVRITEAADVMQTGVIRFDALCDARLIEVETGRLAASFSLSSGALGFSKAQAARKAAVEVAGKLAAEFVAWLATNAGSARTVELLVEGLPALASANRLAVVLQQSPNIESARLLRYAREASKFEVNTVSSPAELGMLLDGARLGLQVTACGEGLIKGSYSAADEVVLAVLPERMTRKKGKRSDRWMEKGLAEVIRLELTNSRFLTLPYGEKVFEPGGSKKEWRERLQSRKIPPDSALILHGAFVREKGGIQVQLSLVRARDGKPVLGAQKLCAESLLSQCVADLGRETVASLRELVENGTVKVPGMKDPAGLAVAGGTFPLTVEGGLSDVLAVRAHGAEGTWLGEWTLTNPGSEAVEDIRAILEVAGYSVAPTEIEVGRLAAGESRKVTLSAPLDVERVAKAGETFTAALRTELHCRQDSLSHFQRRTRAIVVHGRNAMDWSHPELISAFVNPRSPELLELVRSLLPGDGFEAADPMSVSAFAFSLLQWLPARYVSDPTSVAPGKTLDYVQFPSELLRRRTGDCEDLSVAFAALAESVGIEVCLAVGSSHVLPAVRLRRPAYSSSLVLPGAGPGMLVEWDGALWAPVEVTRLEGTLVEAWEAGGKTVAVWEKEGGLSWVCPRSHWREVPPYPVAGTKELEMPDAKTFAAVLEGNTRALERHVAAARKQRLKELSAPTGTPADLASRAALLATAGDMDGAAALLQQCLASAPEQIECRVNRANLLALTGKTAQAVEELSEAALGNQGAMSPRFNLAVLHFLQGEMAEAHRSLLAAMERGGGEQIAAMARAESTSVGEKHSDGAGATLGGLARLARGVQGKKVAPPSGGTKADSTDASSAALRYLMWH